MTPEEKKDWKPEKFPQPRTFPSEWDMSGLMASSERGVDKEAAEEWKPESFPQPRTFPKGWHFDDRK